MGFMAKEYKTPDDRVAIAGVFGENGGTIVTNTSQVTGDFNCVYPIEDSVISSCTTPDFAGSLNGLTLKAGIPFYGRVTALTLTSGKVVLYKPVVKV